MSTNDPNTPSRADVRAVLGFVQGSDGTVEINSFRPHILSCDTLYVRGEAYVYGRLIATLDISSATFGSGSAGAPSIAFSAAPTTGLYETGTGVGVTSGGVQQMAIGPSNVRVIPPLVLDSSLSVNGIITTPSSQNLVINPSGASIDFTGHTLINVGGISSNANRYEIIASASAMTIGATTAVIYSIPTVSGATYTLVTDIALVDTTDGTSTGAITLTCKCKNIGGTLTISTPQNYTAVDTALVGAAVSFVVSGVNIDVTANGVAGQTIKWFGATSVTRQLF